MMVHYNTAGPHQAYVDGKVMKPITCRACIICGFYYHRKAGNGWYFVQYLSAVVPPPISVIAESAGTLRRVGRGGDIYRE
ncbi:hypothetical protein KCP75_17450 [Salmonella enterica subsp. enterica]|nr:hypothetical protein KCP75_17450 [Salmonella enterica subsp. enterica]